MKMALANWLVGVVVAFLLVCKHLKIYTNESTRYEAFWGRGDALAFGVVILLLGTAFFVAHQITRKLRLRWLNRVADAVFVLAVGYAAVAYPRTGWMDAAHPWLPTLCVLMTYVVSILALAGLTTRFAVIPRACRAGCLVLSPVVPLVLLQLLTYPVFSVSREPLPAPGHSGARQSLPAADAPISIYVFIFDQWSYARTFTGPDMERELPNLARLARQATTYHDAHSPYAYTLRSLPGILFQTEDEFLLDRGRIGFKNAAGEFVDVGNRRNLFSTMNQMGYRTYMSGWVHPYRRMFGSELDFAYSAPCAHGNGNDDKVLKSVARHLLSGFAVSTTAVPKPAGLQWRVQRFWNRLIDYNETEMLTSIHNLAMNIIQHQTGPHFAVFHYPIPHDPYIYNREGLDLDVRRRMPLNFTPRPDGTFTRPDPQNEIARYTGNLHYTDTLLGELVKAMKAAGLYDESMIILTSDHNWCLDPHFDDQAGSDEYTHVPLVVKSAHQACPREIHDPFLLSGLRDLMENSCRVTAAADSLPSQKSRILTGS